MTLDSTISRLLADAGQDLRVAVRRLRRQPWLNAAVLATLGLGLGAAAAIFTAVNAALLRPPPFAAPDRLVHLWERRDDRPGQLPASWPTFRDWRARVASFAALEGYDPSNITVGIGDDARMLRGAQVTPGFFPMLGVTPRAGAGFTGDAPDGQALVSAAFADRYDAGPGRTITVNGTPFVIAGILPPSFNFAPLQDAAVFTPLGSGDDDRGAPAVRVVARLAPGASLSAARGELNATMAALAREYPESMRGHRADAIPLREALLGNVRVILLSLAGAVALLLVTLGTNVALLMLTRHLARAPELRMRSALGASRGRLARQLAAESLALAAGGFVLALLVGDAAVSLLLAAIPDGVRIGMPYLASAGLDGATIGFLAAASLALTTAFGVGPALLATQRIGRPADTRTTGGAAEGRLRGGLVTAQIALTVVLLVVSGLLVGSVRNLLRVDVGIADPATLVTARVPLSGPRYQDPAAQQRFFDALVADANRLPGTRAAAISRLPLNGGGTVAFAATDRPDPVAERERAVLRMVVGDYFAVAGIAVREGRAFTDGDGADRPFVVVVSRALAARLGASGPVIGRRLHLGGDTTTWQVIGVAGDVQTAALDAEALPAIYVSHRQLAENRMSLVLRARGGTDAALAGVRAIVRRLDPGVPVYAAGTFARELDDSRALFTRRLPMVLCLVFAGTALALALIALYALCAHEVTARRREYGIRIALGARPAAVRNTVLRNGLRPAVLGAAIGLVAAFPAGRGMASLLYGMAGSDARVFVAVGAGIVAAAAAASLAPALRAQRLDPAAIMRDS